MIADELHHCNSYNNGNKSTILQFKELTYVLFCGVHFNKCAASKLRKKRLDYNKFKYVNSYFHLVSVNTKKRGG